MPDRNPTHPESENSQADPEMKGIPPPRTVGLFLSSLLILISLLRSEGGMGGLAVCTKPLLAGRDGFPVAEPV
jgi:hypothetical protein